MAVPEPFPSLTEVIDSMGRAGRTVAGISASEGAAGNISVCLRWDMEVRRVFPLHEPLALPTPVPELAGATVLVTGSGRRLREVSDDPGANLGAVKIDADGAHATMYTAPRRLFEQLTSEFNSHLAVHADQVARTDTNFHAIIHAQPPRLTLLSHIPEYRSTEAMTRQLLRWEPETIVNLPEGICILPFMLPGSIELQEANVAGLRTHRIVVWSKHGVMARSDHSATRAADIIEYAETAAGYEYLDLATGSRAEGLTADELGSIVRAFDVPTTLY